EALASAPLDDAQLKRLAAVVAESGVLELPRLVTAFEQSRSGDVGRALVEALGRSPGLANLQSQSLVAGLTNFPPEVRQPADPLIKRLRVDVEKQRARLSELTEVLDGGDIQRGRELFFANKRPSAPPATPCKRRAATSVLT